MNSPDKFKASSDRRSYKELVAIFNLSHWDDVGLKQGGGYREAERFLFFGYLGVRIEKSWGLFWSPTGISSSLSPKPQASADSKSLPL